MVASKQIAENYVETGRKKAELPVSHMLILGFFAGMFIALAGAGASVASAAMTNASASRIASALVFPAGLALVVCTGAELFTGNCLMMISALQKRISVGGLFKNLLFVYLGNLIGAIFVAILFVYGHIPSLYGGDLAQVLLNTAVSKVTLTLPEMLCRAILCNVLVCIAVRAGIWQNSGALSAGGDFHSLRLRALHRQYVLHPGGVDDHGRVRSGSGRADDRNLYSQ